MEKAIKKAIEGGWRPSEKAQMMVSNFNKEKTIQVGDHFCLDPLFWQALSKAEGWGNAYCKSCGYINSGNCGKLPEWRMHWVNFTHHLAEGKSIDEFFNNLIK